MTQSVPACPYPRCLFRTTDIRELGQHLIDYPDIDEHHLLDGGDTESSEPAPRRARFVAANLTPPAVLEAGDHIARYTEPEQRRPGWLRVEMPCCPRMGQQAARKLLLPALPVSGGDDKAVCPSCGWLYTWWLEDEGGDDYLAHLEVIGVITVAGTRRTYTNPL